jgi:GAF domain-containing protein
MNLNDERKEGSISLHEAPRIPSHEEKSALYEQCESELRAILHGVTDTMTILSTIVAVLHHRMPHYFWTGFYRDVDGMLRVGPYQGTPACLAIPYERGVCGAAWSKGEAVVVEDVHAFPGHIACDSRSESEIVVPWFLQGTMIGVLDVDSTLLAAFDDIDRSALQRLASLW